MSVIFQQEFREDDYYIAVAQETNYTVYYVNGNNDELVKEGILAISGTLILPSNKDGIYKVILTDNVDTEQLIFLVVKFLQNSIIKSIKNYICNCNCGCTGSDFECMTKIGEQCVKHKAIYNKIITYQHLYISEYLPNYLTNFTKFVASALLTSTCKVQNQINDYLRQECITGGVKSVEKLSKLYFAIYWFGMYFVDKHLYGDKEKELKFIKTKYKYDELIKCLCDLCLDADELEAIFFDPVPPIDPDIPNPAKEELLFDENTGQPAEWDFLAYSTPGYLDLNSTDAPTNGTYCIAFKGADAPDYIEGKKSSMIDIGDYVALTLTINPQGIAPKFFPLKLVFINSITGDTSSAAYLDSGYFGYDSNLLTAQRILIPIAIFRGTTTQFDTFNLSIGDEVNPAKYGTVYIDEIKLIKLTN